MSAAQAGFSFQRLRWFRITGMAEGTSFLVLLLLAMPMKYWLGWPMAVRVTGWAHGVLFIAYILMVFNCRRIMQWGIGTTVLALIASLIPFGPFLLDKNIRHRSLQLAEVHAKG